MSTFTFSDKKVLIVEDQRPFLIMMRGLLQGLGVPSITTTHSAEQAVLLCQKNAFDMVIADLHYGNDRKNGFELVEELRLKQWLRSDAIFLLFSADSARPSVMGSIEKRPDDFLVKPFSQAQLKSRLTRAWQKRQYLAPIYIAIDKGHLTQAIETAKSLMTQKSPYARQCLQILIELYWKTEQSEKAMQLIEGDERGQHSLWMRIAKGKTLLALKKYDQTAEFANQLIKDNKFCVEAYDVLAEALSGLHESENALDIIRQAIKISPYSLPRQFTACRIAREHGDYGLAAETCLSIWELSKRSVHQSASHWCGYISSLLDAAEYSKEKKHKNRFQQEVLLAMQRSKNDDQLARMSQSYNFAIFEDLVHARINAIDGKLLEAKKNLAQSQFTIDTQFESFPAIYAADSVQTLLKIGEYEQGQQLIDRLASEDTELNLNSQYSITQCLHQVSDKRQAYLALNKKGIGLYQEGKLAEAKEVFHEAQELTPVNTSVALNLLQCLLKMINQNKNRKIDAKLVSECRSVYRIIDGMPLVGQHKEKFDSLQVELDALLN